MNNKAKESLVVKSKVSIFCGHAIEGLWLFLLIGMPLFYWKSYQSFDMPKMQLLCTVTAVMIALWIIKSLEEKRFDLRRGIFPIILGAYFLILIVSTIFGYYPSVSWWGSYVRFTGLSMYGFFLLASFLIFINIKSHDQIKRIFGFLAAGSIPVSIYGLLQYFRLDVLEFTGTREGFREIISTLGNSLYLSNYLIMVIPAALALIFYSRKIYFKILWGMVALIDIWALILTQKRSGFFALVAVLAFGSFLLVWRRKRIVAIAAAAVALALVLVIAFNFGPISQSDLVADYPYLKRIFSSFDFQDVTVKERLVVWRITADMLLARPVLGYGLDTYMYVFNAYYPPSFTEMPEIYFDRAHNFILDTAHSTGSLGLLAMLGLFGLAFWQSGKMFFFRKNSPDSYFGWAMVVIMVGFLVHNMFMFEVSPSRYILFMVFSIGASIPFLKDQPPAANNDNVKPQAKIKFWNIREYKLIYYALLVIALVYSVKFHIFPIVGDYHYNKGLGYAKLEDKQVRESEFTKAMYYMSDVRSANYHEKLASDYFIFSQNVKPELRDENFQKSVDWYNKAMEKDPLKYQTPTDLGQVYVVWAGYAEKESDLRRERLAKAEQAFNKAAELSPGRQMTYWEWGRSLIHIGETDLGLEKYIFAVELDPGVGKSHFMLAKAYRDTGDLEKARQAFDRAYELGYTREKEDAPL